MNASANFLPRCTRSLEKLPQMIFFDQTEQGESFDMVMQRANQCHQIVDQIRLFHTSLDGLSTELTRNQSSMIETLSDTLQSRKYLLLCTTPEEVSETFVEWQKVLDSLWNLMLRPPGSELAQRLESSLDMVHSLTSLDHNGSTDIKRHKLSKNPQDAEKAYRAELHLLSNKSAREKFGDLERSILEHHLAMNLCEQGRIEDAKKHFQKALALGEKAFGPQTPGIVSHALKIALTLCEYRDFEGAAEISQALRREYTGESFKNSLLRLGERSFIMLVKFGDLAISLWNENKLHEALEMQLIDFDLRQHILGYDDSRTLESADHLAAIWSTLGELVEAENGYRRLLSSRQKALGETHHLTLDTFDRLVMVLYEQDKFDEARSELRAQALKVRRTGFGANMVSAILRSKENIFGDHHPLMLFAMDTLAMALFDEGFHQEASDLNQQVLELRQNHLGSEHPETLHTMHIQGRYLAELDKFEEAESLLRRTLDLRTKVLDLGDPDTRQSLRRLLEVILKRGEGEKAEDTFRQMLPVLNINLGNLDEDPVLKAHLVLALQMQGRYKEANDVRQRGIYHLGPATNLSPTVERTGNEGTGHSDSGAEQDSQHSREIGVSGSPDEIVDSKNTGSSAGKARQSQRKFKTRTFRLPTRGEEWYIFAYELARTLGFKNTFHLLSENRSLSTIILEADEVGALVDQDPLLFGRDRDFVMVTAESAFRQFGRRITHHGQRGSDNDSDTSDIRDATVALNEGDDILILKHKTTRHTLHFQTLSIQNGLLTVGDVRKRVAMVTWWGQERHRVTLYFQGKRLRHDRRTCKEEGLRSLSEIECITNATSKRSGDPDVGIDRSNSYNMLGPLAPPDEGRPSLHNGGLVIQPSISALSNTSLSPHFISAKSLNELLQSCLPESLLLLDLRDNSEYESSHINGASSFCVPGLTFSHPQYYEMLAQEGAKKKLADLQVVDYIVMYDANSSLPVDLTAFMNTFQRTIRKDWNGTLAVLRGGFTSFAKKFPHMVSGDSTDTPAAPSRSASGDLFPHAKNSTSSDPLGEIAAIEAGLRAETTDSIGRIVPIKQSSVDLRGLLVGYIDTLHALKSNGDKIAAARRDAVLKQCLSYLDSLDNTLRETRASEAASAAQAESETAVESTVNASEAVASQHEDQITESVEVSPVKYHQLIGLGGKTRRELEEDFEVSISIPKESQQDLQIKITGQLEKVQKAKQHILKLVEDQVSETIQVPRTKHHFISNSGLLFRFLRNELRVTVDHAGHQPPPRISAQAQSHVRSMNDHPWGIVANADECSEEGNIPWVLHGSTESIAKARKTIQKALSLEQPSHTGYLVLHDSNLHRSIIGPGGAKINSIREQTGCKISVPRNQAQNEPIVISGSLEGVEQARAIILDVVKSVKTGEAVELAADKVTQNPDAEYPTSLQPLSTGLALGPRMPENHEGSSLQDVSRKYVSNLEAVSDNEPAQHAVSNIRDEPLRTWTDWLSFTITARLVRYNDGIVTLLKKDGVEIEIPITRLTVSDYLYITTKYLDLEVSGNHSNHGVSGKPLLPLEELKSCEDYVYKVWIPAVQSLVASTPVNRRLREHEYQQLRDELGTALTALSVKRPLDGKQGISQIRNRVKNGMHKWLSQLNFAQDEIRGNHEEEIG